MYIVSEIIDILCTDESTITHIKEFFFFFSDTLGRQSLS